MQSATEIVNALRLAVAQLERAKVRALCRDLVDEVRRSGEQFAPADAAAILDLLRKKRHFGEVTQIADVLIQTGHHAPVIRRHYAQAVIELGQPALAAELLHRLLPDTTRDPNENAEARGLLGRAYKQMYIDAGNPGSDYARQALALAANAYYSVYAEEPTQHLWHGINAVAVLSRAARDEIYLGDFPDPTPVAQAVREQVARRQKGGSVSLWDAATAAEACVAVSEGEEALRWMTQYLEGVRVRWQGSEIVDRADAFELASTHRQLVEVWQLDEHEGIGGLLLPVLRARLLEANGGVLELAPGEAGKGLRSQGPDDRKRFERTLGAEIYRDLEWYDDGRARCELVALIGRRKTWGVGTGFLIRGGDLWDRFGDDVFLLTNAHVVTDDDAVHEQCRFSPPLRSDRAVITFHGRRDVDRETQYQVAHLEWTSPPDELDATLLRLRETPTTAPCPVAAALPALDTDPAPRVYVIGHPNQGPLSISLHDNALLDYERSEATSNPLGPRYMHYRSPTNPGSSGSPLFNDEWELVGIHHAGGEEVRRLNGDDGSYEANEGIWIEAIRRRIAMERQ